MTEKKENSKEKVNEIYKIEGNGKEKIIEKEGTIEEAPVKKNRIEKENKTLKIVLISIGIVFLLVIIIALISKASSVIKYEGVKFTAIKQGDLIFYNTTFPILYKEGTAYYIIYLRNNPEELKKEVSFKGELNSLDTTVINITDEFKCDGYGVIAIANLVNLYGAINQTIMKDENASCDELGRYTYLVIQPGNETSVEQFGTAGNCYKININNCEILKGTERYILEMLVKINSNVYWEE
jgi:hypothetical protein